MEFQNPKKAVRFDICDRKQQIQQVGQGCGVGNVNDYSSRSSVSRSLTANSTAAGCSPSIIISNEEIKDCWYDRSEMMGFRQQAIELAIFQYNNSNGVEESLPRGMESSSRKRRKHKANTRRFVLLAHRIGKDQDYLARLSAKLGRWNKEIAIRDACLDYFEIYQPSFVQCVPPVFSKPPNIPRVPKYAVRTDSTRSRSKTEGSPLSSR